MNNKSASRLPAIAIFSTNHTIRNSRKHIFKTFLLIVNDFKHTLKRKQYNYIIGVR